MLAKIVFVMEIIYTEVSLRVQDLWDVMHCWLSDT